MERQIQPHVPKPGTPRELQSVIFAERELEPFIYFRDGEQALVLMPLSGSNEHTVGRHEGSDIPLSFDRTVSGAHAQILKVGGEWVVEDDGLSTNGTFVNGVRLRERKRLRDSDTVRFGETTLVFRLPGESSFASTGIPADTPQVDVTPAQLKVLLELCRPAFEADGSQPASNQEIADTLFLGLETVKTHMRALYSAFLLDDVLPREKRSMLVTRAEQFGVVTAGDYN